MTWRCTVLRAGSFRLDGGGMFGVVPKALWSRMTDVAEDNTIPLQTNCLLLEDGDRRVLVETGNGEKWSDKERAIYHLERRTVLDALAERDVDPGSISDVVVTHLHFDHAGGLTRYAPDGTTPIPSFPNARIHVQEREWRDADANRAVMTRTYLRSHLDPVAAATELADGEATILDGIRVMPVPGHTWGQQAVIVETTAGTICFPGDVMPTVNHAGDAFNMGYDIEPYTNMRTKRSLLERAAGEGWTVVLDHEPGEPAVRVREDPDRPGRYRLEPAPLDG
jgi:glyoxylase-like metal-dependent hydrolase (beta-lactamase superfamily II)